MSKDKASFEIKFYLEQMITRYTSIKLSLSQIEPPKKKALTSKAHAKYARKTVAEHLEGMIKNGRLSDPSRPLMVLSARNVLSNLRCIAYIKGLTQTPISVAEEYPVLKQAIEGESACFRPYHVLGDLNGQIVIDEWNPHQSNGYEWFFSGVPVLWDDEAPDELFERMITEAADHSHIWHLPRANHPDTTPASEGHWLKLQEIFTQSLTESRTSVFQRLCEYAQKNGLQRESNYLHHIIGIDSNGHLHQLVDSGRLEDLATKLRSKGVSRALCVDNGGSVTTRFFPQGYRDTIESGCISLLTAPNHRPIGTSYLVIELKDSGFKLTKEKHRDCE